MPSRDRTVAGLLVFLAAAQFTVGLMIAASRYPGYSIADNFISDLGVGPAALIFNGSVVLLGVLVLLAVPFIHRVFRSRLLTALLIVVGAGAIGVGVFPENVPTLHWVFSAIAFTSSGVSAIVAAFFLRPPLRYLSVIIGVVSLGALVLFGTSNYLGLGVGGMERMIVLPVLAWGMALGGYLMAGDAE